MILALASLILTQDLPKLTAQRLGDTGLICMLPEGAEFQKSESAAEVTYQKDNFKVTITATRPDKMPDLSQRFLDSVKSARKRFHDKVATQLNFPTLGTEIAYGADDSFGVYIQGKDRGVNAIFWSGLIADGWFYETKAECEASKRAYMEAIVGSYRLVNPDGTYRVTKVKDMPISLVAGGSFTPILLPSGQPMSGKAKFVSVNHVPVTAMVDIWERSNVDINNPDDVAGQLRKLILSRGQHNRIDIQGRTVPGTDAKTVEVLGSIPGEKSSIYILGRVVDSPEGLLAVVTLRTEESGDQKLFSEKMVESIRLTQDETMSD